MHPDDGVAVFREIVAQHERGGADDALILDGIDHSDRATLGAEDLARSLARLEAAGCIERRGGRWLVAAALVGALPRTRSGALTTGSEAWRRFAEARIRPLFWH